MITLMSTGPDWTQTAIRVILGMVFFANGARKLKGWIAGAGLRETLRGNDVAVLWRCGPHSRFTRPRGCNRDLRHDVVRHRDSAMALRMPSPGHRTGDRNYCAGLRRIVAGPPLVSYLAIKRSIQNEFTNT